MTLYVDPDHQTFTVDEIVAGNGVWYATHPDVPHQSYTDIDPDQVSPVWDRRAVLRRPDGTWAVLTVSLYLTRTGTDPTRLDQQIEAVICTDPADPGNTEQASEYVYRTIAVDHPGAATPADARAACAAAPTPAIRWDGINLRDVKTEGNQP